MKKKLKIYCALLALVLTGVYICKPFSIYTHTHTQIGMEKRLSWIL